jgi:hypothetical protein
MKAILVGRHAGEIPGVEVIEQRAVTWPADSAGCVLVLEQLFDAANAAGAVLVFQNTPGQIAAALARNCADRAQNAPTPWAWKGVGIIVSIPGERPGRIRKTVWAEDAQFAISEAVRFANPRAELDVDVDSFAVTVTVDGPPMPFKFSHIEWLN